MKNKVLIGSIALVAVAGAATAWVMTDSPYRRVSQSSDTGVSKAIQEQRAKVVSLEFPTASETVPATMKTTYDPAEKRTRMTLRFKDLAPSHPLPGGASKLQLRFTSEFAGTTRDPKKPELSVIAAVEMITTKPGALILGSDLPSFNVDGRHIETRPVKVGASGHETHRKGALNTETFRFKIATEELLDVANGTKVGFRAGPVQLNLSAEQLHDIREFVARMNPNTTIVGGQ